MKLLLIVPQKNKKDREYLDFKFAASFISGKRGYFGVSLSIPTIAAIAPEDVDVRIIDENVESIPFDYDANLVGITVMTLQAIRAYEIADEFRRRGKRVVLGGVHVSMLPEEAAKHADSVFVGEAEGRWPEVINDAKKGDLKKFYYPLTADSRPDLSLSPKPRFELLQNDVYVGTLMQTSRGCPFDCDFCSVQDFLGSKMRYKTTAQVVDEIEHIYKFVVKRNYAKQLFITDDNFTGNRKRVRELLTEALIPMHRKHDLNGWAVQCAISVANDDETLSLMKEAGCRYVLIGFETFTAEGLKYLGKGINQSIDYSEAIRKIKSHDLDVVGLFILGHDHDDLSCFKKLVDFIDDNVILNNNINILTPLPGTKLFYRLQAEGRINHYDWSKYDTQHVVFKPKLMSEKELLEGFIWANEKIYGLKKMHKKLRNEVWKYQDKGLSFGDRAKFAIRLMSYLSLSDWDRTSFIFRVLPDVFNPRLDSLANIVNCMDHQDFARNLSRRHR